MDLHSSSAAASAAAAAQMGISLELPCHLAAQAVAAEQSEQAQQDSPLAGAWSLGVQQYNLLACYGLGRAEALAVIARQRDLRAARRSRRAAASPGCSETEGGSSGVESG